MNFFQCFVTVDTKTVAYNIDDNKEVTVYDLKLFVWDRVGIHPDNFYFVYGSSMLKDDDILSNVVQHDHTVRTRYRSQFRTHGFRNDIQIVNNNNNVCSQS